MVHEYLLLSRADVEGSEEDIASSLIVAVDISHDGVEVFFAASKPLTLRQVTNLAQLLSIEVVEIDMVEAVTLACEQDVVLSYLHMSEDIFINVFVNLVLNNLLTNGSQR